VPGTSRPSRTAELNSDCPLVMTLTSFTYVSSRTGTEYLIVPKTSTRMRGDWYKGEPLRPVEETTYEVVLMGNPVQFSLSIEGIPDAVSHFECPGPDLGSPRD
jgi:hypothetical protein